VNLLEILSASVLRVSAMPWALWLLSSNGSWIAVHGDVHREMSGP